MPDSKVIVLDPGHGGENIGLDYRGFVEKDMNQIVANAMKDTLSQFDDVKVYITNPEAEDMSLKERAEYAKSVGADVIICLHFNMSEEHNMYGSEVWIPSAGLGYSKMHSLGDIFIDQLSERGLTVRGVKTRLNNKGTDYYGIIRESAELDIPCILVEHAYADHNMDIAFIDSEEDLKTLGVCDAQAVAKYFHLKSRSLGTDYTNFVKNGYFAPEAPVAGDQTEPADAQLIWLGEEGSYTSADEQTFLIGAKEYESTLVYYDYSVDGGETWSDLFPFARDMTQMEITIPNVLPGSKVVARIYNGHYLYAETNAVAFTPEEKTKQETTVKPQETLPETSPAEATEEPVIEPETVTTAAETQPKGNTTSYLFCGFGIFLSAMLFLAAFFTYKMQRGKKAEWRERILLVASLIVLLVSVTALGRIVLRSTMPSGQVQTAALTDETADAAGQENEVGAAGVDLAENGQQAPVAQTAPEQADEQQENGIQEPFYLTLWSYNGDSAKLPKVTTYVPDEKNTAVVYDIAEGLMRVPLLTNVPPNPYQLTAFSGSDLSMSYNGDRQAVLGIDVSKFQGAIDYESVREAGVEFVMIRLGLRGYGSGELTMDDWFYENLESAQAAGLRTGVYFFSAAINEDEAREEADFVASALEGYEINMPVVFDTEPIFHDTARTDDLTPNQLTAITRAFCERTQSLGYVPMIYANAKRFATVLHLDQLTGYRLWLADYRQAPDFPYQFSMWQFTEHGSVPGVSGEVDIDMYFPD